MRSNRLLVIKCMCVFCFGFMIAAGGAALAKEKPATGYSQLKYQKIRDIQMPDIKEISLSNGMKLLLLEDHELPLINISAIIRTGSVYEDANKAGLASITGEVLRTGGTTTRGGEEIDEKLEGIAASVETNIGGNSGSARLSVLKEDFDTGLGIFADVLMNPVFAEDKIELAKINRRTEISRRNDYVGAIGLREFSKLIYGAASPYARHIEYATINNIKRDDIAAFYKKFYFPSNMMLAVWGDFNTDDMIKKLDNAFKGWQKGNIEILPLPGVSYQYRYTVNLAEKSDINQSAIYIGHIGGLMSDADYPSLVIMNKILCDSFTSRMFKNIRSRMGLAYSAGGSFSAGYNYPGIFYVWSQTNCGATVKAIRAMREQIKSMTESEVTDEEIAVAKESYLNTFVFNFDSKAKIINNMMALQYYGYPKDFLFKVKDAVEKVTKADVLRVSKRHLQPDKIQIFVVGKPQEFDQPLSTLGEVNKIDITIPKP